MSSIAIRCSWTVALSLVLAVAFPESSLQAESPAIRLLFLGDNGHHRPMDRFSQIRPVLAKSGIEVTYTDKLEMLNAKTLADYDGLVVYANQTKISPEQEQALLDYVAAGKGFIPLHCASYCFLNSPKYIELVGAQFQKHGTGTFRTTIAEPDHAIVKGFSGFESWDETYVHSKHNEKDRTVLEYREDATGKEPWTWVRTHGKGRVFYTAWGHDERTWGNAGFQDLLVRGIRWAVGETLNAEVGTRNAEGNSTAFRVPRSAFPIPSLTRPRTDVKPFEYVEAKIAFYPPEGRTRGDGSWNKMQLPLSVEESMKHLRVPEGFRVELFAAEPQIGKPICMNWDERGRLWIAETVDYPNELQREGAGRDRIRICEDTDGDKRADKFTLFADKLSIPTSLLFARGGVIVHQAPHTLFLQDTDGDDVADKREILFSGWNTRDTHAGPSNLVYGLDNWIWGMQGYAGFSGTVGGERHQFSQGFYRFQADGSKLEFLRSTNNNTWGIGFSEEGIVFGSTANRNPSVYLPIPNRYYEAVRGWSASQLGSIADTHLFKAVTEKVRQVDHHHGYTAAAGHALYTARRYPREYWNQTAFVTEPTGHLVGTFVLTPTGSDFQSTNPCNLLASDDEWTAPIMAEVGPDGNVWVIDWYNYIVQHNPTPAGFQTGKGAAYETDLRDKKHGRIYRVVHGQGDKERGRQGDEETGRFTLAGATPEKLVATLKSDNLFWRRHAQRLLVERGKNDVVPALIELVRDANVDDIGLNTGAIHALWTLHGLGASDGSHKAATTAAITAVSHKSPGVQRNAVAVLPRENQSTLAILSSRLMENRDPQVRLAALLALSEMPPHTEAGAAIAAFLARPENSSDRWLPDAATSAAATHDIYFLQAVASQKAPTSTRLLATVGIVAEHYARGGPVDTASNFLASLSSADGALLDPIITGLAKGWPKGRPAKLEADGEQALVKLLEKLTPGGKGQLINLASAWGSTALKAYAEEIVAALATVVADEKQADEARIAAARQLVQFRASDAAVAGQLLKAVSPRTSPAAAVGLIDALAASQAEAVGPDLVSRLAGFTPTAKSAAIRVLLGRAEWTRTLLSEIEQGNVPLYELALEQKQALAAHPDRQLAARAKRLLERGGGLPNADRQKVLAELSPLIERTGDAALGKEVFKKQCAKCHTHSGEGNKIGPDLTGMAVHPKKELLANLIDPSRSVEGNYRVYTVVTVDGRVLNGLLTSESKTAIELLDAENKKHAVLREDIDELAASAKSLMPEGFEKQVPPDDIVNLLEFMTLRGRFVPLPLAKAATIVSTKGMFHDESAGVERLIFSDWLPKTFKEVPFTLIDPNGDRTPNVVLLNGPNGKFPPQMPKSVRVPCNMPAKAIHLLSGVSGWGFPNGRRGSVSMIVRLHYQDGSTEDHPLRNGEHFADYIRRIDVPNSDFAFALRGQQVRYLAVVPLRDAVIAEVEFVKGDDATAPVVMAATAESRQ